MSEAQRNLVNSDPNVVFDLARGDFHLLAIGIDQYASWDRLTTAVQGAKAVAELLAGDYGFARVTTLLDGEATRSRIIAELRRLAKDVAPDDSLLIYFAGHGHLDELTHSGAWVPVDGGAPMNQTDHSAASSWIENHTVKETIRACKARHILLISDSCFAGDFLRGYREAPPHITDAYVRKAFARASRHVMTSGGLEPVSDGGAEGHSVFTWFLLRALQDHDWPYILPSQLHDRVKGGVAANASQVPALGVLQNTLGEVGGEFVLFKNRPATHGEDPAKTERDPRGEPKQDAEVEIDPSPQPPHEDQTPRWRWLGAGAALFILAAAVAFSWAWRVSREVRVRDEVIQRLRHFSSFTNLAELRSLQRFMEASVERLSPKNAALVEKDWEKIKRRRPRDISYVPEMASRGAPFVNSLGMKFVPVPIAVDGSETVVFSIWETRMKDYEAYASANAGVDATWADPHWDELYVKQGPDYPVVYINWNDAKRFCQWLTAKERAEGLIGLHQVYRLPTDTEWSWAAGIGGVEIGDGTPRSPEEKNEKVKEGDWAYPWGRGWPPLKGDGNYADESFKSRFAKGNSIPRYDDGYVTTSPVGMFNANRYGIFDLGGNAGEWVEEFFNGKDGKRTTRGGTWRNSYSHELLSSSRGSIDARSRYNNCGFRVVISATAR